MSSVDEPSGGSRSNGPVRGPQSLAGGLVLLALAALALWLTRDLSKGTLRSMGPAMLPDWLAYGVALCGLALVATAFMKAGEALERWSIRGPLLVLIAILAFAVTIRPFSFGSLSIPGLGLVVGGTARHPHRRLCDPGGAPARSRDPGAQPDALLHAPLRRPAEPADPDLPAEPRRPFPGRLEPEGHPARHGGRHARSRPRGVSGGAAHERRTRSTWPIIQDGS